MAHTHTYTHTQYKILHLENLWQLIFYPTKILHENIIFMPPSLSIIKNLENKTP